MSHIIPYVNFADNGREMLEFYKGVFGGDYEITLVKDSPMSQHMPAEWGERIMHVEFKSDDFVFYGSDIISDQQGRVIGNGIQLAVMCNSDEQLTSYFTALKEGGTVVMEPSPSEWGSTFGQCADKYGLNWMLECPKA